MGNYYINAISDIGFDDSRQSYIKCVTFPDTEWDHLEVIPCDENGNNLKYDDALTVNYEDIRKNIIIPANEHNDLYYRVVPVLKSGDRIQTGEDGNMANFVVAKRIRITIKCNFTAGKVKNGLFKHKSITPASLTYSCESDVPTGVLGYRVGSIFYPLPARKNENLILPAGIVVNDIQLNKNAASIYSLSIMENKSK